MDDKLNSGGFRKDIIKFTGFENSKITFIGTPNSGKTNMIFDASIRDKISKQGRCILEDTIKFLKENGISTPITNYERIGENYFPVTYLENGTIYVDYPPKMLKKIKEITDQKLDLEKFSIEISKLRDEYNFKIILPKSPIE